MADGEMKAIVDAVSGMIRGVREEWRQVRNAYGRIMVPLTWKDGHTHR